MIQNEDSGAAYGIGGPDFDIEALLERMRPPSLPCEVCEKLPKFKTWLTRLDRSHALASLAALQAMPEYHANTIRLDWAMRLVAAFANGKERLNREKLAMLLNVSLKKADVTRLEDPIEDFFVAPIITREGEFLTFQSTWENAAFHTEVLLEAFRALPDDQPKRDALACAHALLLVGNAIIERKGLERWVPGSGQPAQTMKLPSQHRINDATAKMKLSWQQIEEIIPDTLLLSPFALPDGAMPSIADQPIGNALVDFKPLLFDANGVTLIAPGSITIAARGYLINEAAIHGTAKRLQCNMLAEEAARLSAGGFENLTGGPDTPAGNEVVRQMVKEVSNGHYVHFVLSMDGFQTWADHGFSGVTKYEEKFFDTVFEGARFARDAAQKKPGFKDGMSILLLGGWGQGRMLEFEVPPDLRGWQFHYLQPVEAITLGALDDAKLPDLRRIWLIERIVRGMGFDLHNPSGFLNLFQWWRESDHALVPEHQADLLPPCHINFGSDRLFSARVESALASDRRALPLPDGSIRRVMRVDPRSHFDRLEPVYACIDAVQLGELLGVVLSGGAPVWISRYVTGPRTFDEYENWRTILRWAEIIMTPQDGLILPAGDCPVLITLNVEPPNADHLNDPVADQEVSDAIFYRVTANGETADLHIGAKWHSGLRRQDNFAEVILAASLLRCIAELRGVHVTPDEALGYVRRIVGSVDLRWRHALIAERPIELLRAHGLLSERYQHVPLSAAALVKCASAFSVPGSRPGQRIEGQEACFDFLTQLQKELLAALCQQISHYKRESVVLTALEQYQIALAEQRAWETSARALRVIHGVEGDQKASFEQRNHINGTIRACSILTEIAASHGAPDSGYEVGAIDFDELQALALHIFAVSDLVPALRAGQIKAEFRISPTGHLLHDHEFGETALGSSVRLLHSQNRADQSEAYGRLYDASAPASGAPDARFLAALQAEYGVPAEIFVQLGNFLVRIAVDLQKSAFAIRRSELLGRLEAMEIEGAPDFAPLIDRLTLPCRNSWDYIPDGARKLDFDISRFDRRFSLIGRPIVAISADDDPLLAVAPGIVERAARHNVAGASAGGLQGDFWVSKEMRSYVGYAGERTGMDFNERVAKAVQAQGLMAAASVKPSACLNHKATDELKRLGDIDVLAFSADGKHAWVIEAKDIKLCRTLSETARRLSEYRGVPLPNGKPDNLLRHLNRVAYVRKHAGDLAKRNNFPEIPQVHGLVIVDVPQPMTFVIASESKDARFVTVDSLSEIDWAAQV